MEHQCPLVPAFLLLLWILQEIQATGCGPFNAKCGHWPAPHQGSCSLSGGDQLALPTAPTSAIVSSHSGLTHALLCLLPQRGVCMEASGSSGFNLCVGPCLHQAFHRGSLLCMVILRNKQPPHPAPCKMTVPAGIVDGYSRKGSENQEPLI